MIARNRLASFIAILGIMTSLAACASPQRVITLDRTGVAVDTYMYVNHQNEGQIEFWPANPLNQVTLNIHDGETIILMQKFDRVAVLRPRGQQLQYVAREDAQTPDPAVSGWISTPMPANGIIRLVEIFPPAATRTLAARYVERKKSAEAYRDLFIPLNDLKPKR